MKTKTQKYEIIKKQKYRVSTGERDVYYLRRKILGFIPVYQIDKYVADGFIAGSMFVFLLFIVPIFLDFRYFYTFSLFQTIFCIMFFVNGKKTYYTHKDAVKGMNSKIKKVLGSKKDKISKFEITAFLEK